MWERGEIRGFLLDSTQQEVIREFEKSNAVKYVFLLGRRVGKSFSLVTYAVEKALRKPYQYIKYSTSTNKSAKDMVMPLFRIVLETCPEHLRPEFRVHDNKWIFKNGSEILLHGIEKDKGDGLRGHAADFAIFDECAFTDGLEEAVNQVVLPMIIERQGRIILASTPPRQSGHPFLSFIAAAEKAKAVSKRTIYDCPRFTAKQIKMYEDEYGGVQSENFRVEYMCEIIRDTSAAIIPEFNDELAKQVVFNDYPDLHYRPDTYVSLDAGFADCAAVLFGFYDFPNATLVIQKEYVAPGKNTQELAEIIKSTEKQLWQGVPPFKRLSDTDLRLIEDLKVLHNLKFQKTAKDNKEAQINMLRIMFNQGRVKIHSSCVNLIMQLKYGQWKTSASGNRDFKRTAELSHNDAIDALLYMFRNVSQNRNPIPEAGYDPTQFWNPYPNNTKISEQAKRLAKAFGA